MAVSPLVLVIEDEPQMLQNLLTILKAEGFTPMGAPDGTRGVELARREKPVLILCDITMPGLDGFGVLELVRSNPQTASIPFIFLTARGEHSDLRTGMNFGADDYLTKPVKVDDLLTAIRARLNRETQRVVRKPDSLQPPESPQDLLPLGLTRREADVLVSDHAIPPPTPSDTRAPTASRKSVISVVSI